MTLSQPAPGPIQQTLLVDALTLLFSPLPVSCSPPPPATLACVSLARTEPSCPLVPRWQCSCRPRCTACPPGCGHARGEGRCVSPGPPRSGPSPCSCRSAGRKEMGVPGSLQNPLPTPAIPPRGHHPSCHSPPILPAPPDMLSLIYIYCASSQAPSRCLCAPAEDAAPSPPQGSAHLNGGIGLAPLLAGCSRQPSV